MNLKLDLFTIRFIGAASIIMQFIHRRLFPSNNIIDGRRLCLTMVVLMQIMLCLDLKSASDSGACQPLGIMGDFARVIRQADGHIDTAATISRLQAANVKSYMYLIYGSTAEIDWNDFIATTGFMDAAQTAGIDVYVYLMPPTEGGPTAPYNKKGTSQDYVNWADAIGSKAQTYSRLKGIVMDDFPLNLVYFTPAVVDSMMTAAHAKCPRLSFQVIDYFTNSADRGHFMFDYADHIDGIIFPYKDLDNLANLNDQIKSARGMMDNVTDYYSISFPAGTQSAAGDYGRISQTVSVTPNQAEYRISFYHFGLALYTLQGYHFKRFLIDGQPVWSNDVAAAGAQCGKVDLDVTSYLTGKTSATLSFELHDAQAVGNYPAGANFKNLAATNVDVHGFYETAYWTYSENNSAFSGIYKTFNPAHGTKCLPLTTMIYAMGTTWHPQTPTSAYIAQGLDIAAKAVIDGNADGVVTYCLDKSSAAGTDYLAAKAAFFNYKDIFYRAGRWMFDEGSGTAAYDSSIFANNGTISNASWDNSDSIAGSSLSFAGASNSYVNALNDASLQLTEDLTLSLWVKPNSLTSRQNPLDKCYYGEFALNIFATPGKLYYFHGSTTSNYFTFVALDDNTIQTNAWQHIVVTRAAGTRTVKSYYNGIPKNTATYSASLLPTASTGSVLIGKGYAGGFAGKIDQPVIYSRALSGGEVFRQYLDRYCHGSWSFDEDCGTTALDKSFYANDGTISNASWDNSDSKSGSSLSFDRSNNSQVSVNNNASLQLTGDLTLSLWVKPGNLTNRQNPLDKCYYGEFALNIFATPGRLYYFHGSTTSNFFTFVALDDNTIQTGVWQHIVITRDAATRTVKSYYNGTLKNTATYSTSQLPTASTSPVKIGNGYNGGFTGKIDEVKIYNKALSATEVTNLYNSYQ